MTKPLIRLTDKDQIVLEQDGHALSVKSYRDILGESADTLLPDGCRFHIQSHFDHVFVIEQPPCIRAVSWEQSADDWTSFVARGGLRKFSVTEQDATRSTYDLAFPFVVFLVFVQDVTVVRGQVFFRKHFLNATDDYLLCAGLLPNDTWILKDQTLLVHHGMTPATVATAAINLFWQQTFGYERDKLIRHPNVSQVSSVWEWEHFSRNPIWVLQADWTAHASHLQHALTTFQCDGTQGKTEDADATFTSLQMLLQDGRLATDQRQTLVESPSCGRLLGKTRVRIGDSLRQRDHTYTVMGFYQPKYGSGDVFTRLESVDTPVCIGDMSGLRDFTLVQPIPAKRADELICDGVTWKAKVIFTVANREDLPLLIPDVNYSIHQLEVDEDGDARVKLTKDADWMYITSQGGKILPSIKHCP